MLLSTEIQHEFYRRMLRIRHVELAVEVQPKEGNNPSVRHSRIGQEVAIIDAFMALRKVIPVDVPMIIHKRAYSNPIWYTP